MMDDPTGTTALLHTHAAGVPRAELYLLVDRPGEYRRRALDGGARELSPLARRSWGHDVACCMDPDRHDVACCMDPDRHVVAFAHAG